MLEEDQNQEVPKAKANQTKSNENAQNEKFLLRESSLTVIQLFSYFILHIPGLSELN